MRVAMRVKNVPMKEIAKKDKPFKLLSTAAGPEWDRQ